MPNSDVEIKGDIYQDMRFKNHKIEKRKDGRWQARYRINGKQLTVYGKTQEACLSKLKESLKQKHIALPQQKTFFEAWEYWVEKYKKPFYKEKTLKNIKSVYKNQLLKYFQDKYLKDITALDINLSLNMVEQPRMKEFTTQYLKEFFKAMYKEQLIKSDISEEIRSFHSVRKEGNSLSVEQRRLLVEKSYLVENGEMFRFYLFSGVRPAELFLIKSSDIEEQFIHIPGTKTEKSDRYIPRFKQLDEVLEKLKNKNGLLFDMSESTRKRRLYELRKLCGFHFNIKDLRTTFATMCAENGIQQNVIAKWLGHTNVSTTNKYYIKVLTDYEKQQIKAFEAKIDTHFDTHFD